MNNSTGSKSHLFFLCIYICGGCILPLIIIDVTNYSQSRCVFGKHFSGSRRSKGVGDSHWWSRPENILIWLFAFVFVSPNSQYVNLQFLDILKIRISLVLLEYLNSGVFCVKDAMTNFQSFTNHSVQGKRKSVSHGVTIDQADADTFFCRSGPLLSSFRLAHPKLMS